MSEIEFSNEEKETIVQKIKLYFEQELNQEIGQFDAEFLLAFPRFLATVSGTYFRDGASSHLPFCLWSFITGSDIVLLARRRN